VVAEADLELADGRTLHSYDAADETSEDGSPWRRSPRPCYYAGGSDLIVPSAHGQWLARHSPTADLWIRPDDGHISVLSAGTAALDWLVERTDAGRR
jgi:hypothetical protein